MRALSCLALAVVVSGCVSVSPLVRAPELPVSLPVPESRAIVVVRVPSPWWAPDFLITGKFVDSIPQYAAAPGLEQEAYTWFSAPVLLDAAAAKRDLTVSAK
jgi:hypothetical protein